MDLADQRSNMKNVISQTQHYRLFPIYSQPGIGDLWGKCEKYLGHAQQVGKWAELCEREREVSALLIRVSDYLYDRGRWREKEVIDKRVYTLRKRQLGGRHLDTVWSMADLAATYYELGRYQEAERINTEVLALRREILGNKHPDTV